MDTTRDETKINEKELLFLGFKRIEQQNENLTFEDYPHYYRFRENCNNEIEVKNLNTTNFFTFSYGRYGCLKLETVQDVIDLVKVLIKTK